MVLLAALCSTTALAAPWSGLSDDVATARGDVAQRVLPALEARAVAAEARAAAAQDVLAGTRAPAEAFPELVGRDLFTPEVVAAQLDALDARGVARAEERATPLPDLENRRSNASLAAAVTRTLKAEEEADRAERAVLYQMRAFLAASPGWSREAVDAARAPLEEAYAASLAQARAAGDADREAALARVATLDAARMRWADVTAAVRDAVLVGRPPQVDPGFEIAALTEGTDPDVAHDADVRLSMLRPLLPADVQARTDQAQLAWLTGPEHSRRAAALALVEASLADEALPTDRIDAASAEQDVAEARAAVAAAEARLGTGADSPAPIGAARRALLELDVQITQARLVVAETRALHVETLTTDAAVKADEARRRLEAMAAIQGSHPALTLRSDSLNHTAAAYDAVDTYEASLRTQREARRALLVELKAVVDAPADRVAGEGMSPDAAYTHLRGLLLDLRALVRAGGLPSDKLFADLTPLAPRDERVAQLDEMARQASEEQDEDLRAELRTVISDARVALADESTPADRAAQVARDEFDEALLDLRLVKSLRHDLRPRISSEESRTDTASLGSDLLDEASLLGMQVQAFLRERARWLAEVPGLVMDPNRVGRMLAGTTWVFVLLVVWAVLRRRIRSLADRAFDLVERAGWPLDAHARELLMPTMSAVLRRLVDAGTAWWLLDEGRRLAPELGIFLGVFVAFSLLRAVGAGIDLVVAVPGRRRPALITVSDTSRSLVHRTWRLLSLWYLATLTIDSVLSDLFFADVLADVVVWMFRLLGFVLVVWLLVRWEPPLLVRARRLGTPPSWLARWTPETGGGALAPVRALVLAGYLGAAAGWDVVQGRAAQRDGYGALVSVMDRVRFVGEAANGEDRPTLDAAVVDKLCGPDVPIEGQMPRKEAEAALTAELARWQTDRRLGVVVVSGDRGDGKRLFFERMTPLLQVEGRAPRITLLEGRIRSREDALRWLERHFGFDETFDDVDALVAKAITLPAQVHVVRHAQNAFLRHVGGFDGLRLLLYAFNATSEAHFWVMGIHRPAWAYLTRLGSLVSTGVVRHVIDLAPLSGPELRALVQRRTEVAGIEVDFRRLENTGPFGAPPEVERERATSSYFRLLAEASGGAPLAALHLWSRSLRPGLGGRWDVVVIPELASGGVGELNPNEMFVLAALRIQDQMTLPELGAVLAAPEDEVRATVRELSHRGLIFLSERGARIETLHVRPVTRTLRRRHVLQWTA